MTRFLFVLLCTALYHNVIAQAGFGNFRNLSREAGAVRIHATGGTLLFRNYPGHVIQTTFESTTYKGEQISNAVLLSPAAEPLQIKVNNAQRLIIANRTTEVEVQKSPLLVTYRHLPTRQEVYLVNYLSADAHQVLQFALVDEAEQFFGAGSRSTVLNKRGQKLGLDNNPWYGYNINADNLNYSLPFYISNHGYGVFFDNPSRGFFDFGSGGKDTLQAGFRAGKLQFYTFFGTQAANVIQQFTALVGRMSLPPRWALGNFMSRFGYRTQDEVMQIAGKMKEQRFPFDAVIIDLFWFGDAVHGAWNMGNLDWNRKRFPDPAKMIADLKQQQIQTILITEPFVLSESFNYQYTQSNKLNALSASGDTVGIKEFFFGHTGLLDIFRNKTKDWFWSKYDAQIKLGVAGWWGDLGEPEKHPNYVYHNMSDFGQKRLFSADEVHNMYGHEWSRMVFEKYARHYPQQRLFHLNRSGYAGTWRYGSVPWSGDVDRSWNGFKAQLPIMLGMGLSGVPTMHSDAGGFAMGQRDPELYRRWLQMAVFSPIFRPHGSVNAPDPKIPQIESEPVFYDEPDKSILRTFVELRYRLMPYVYTLMYEAATKGYPMVRPLFFEDASDPNLYKATDQYLFGDALLVAPVLEKGAGSRKLYLPKGKWYDFFEPGRSYEGGNWIEVELRADRIPVFVKAGAVIPMLPVFENTARYPGTQLQLHYFTNAGTSNSQMYEDDGANPAALQQKQFELIRFTGKQNADGGSLQFSSIGTYKGKPQQRKVDVVVYGVPQPKQVLVNQRPASNMEADATGGWRLNGISWNGAATTVSWK